jgi:hypothetical protein
MQQNPPLFQNRGLTASLPGVKTSSGQIIALTSNFFSWLQPELSARGVNVSKQRRGLYTWSSPAGNAVDMSREAIAIMLIKEVNKVFGVDLTGFFNQFIRNIDAIAAMREISQKLDESAVMRSQLKSIISFKVGSVAAHSDIRGAMPVEMRGMFDQSGSAEIWKLFSIQQTRRGKTRARVYYNLSLAAPESMAGADSSSAGGQAHPLHPFFKKSSN